MPLHEDLELLQAALALAMVDGHMSSAERGVIQGLAVRVGVGEVSLDAMVKRAKEDPQAYEELRMTSAAGARRALELLVAQARIDGRITADERELLVKIAQNLGIGTDEFGRIFALGVTRADDLRERRGKTSQ